MICSTLFVTSGCEQLADRACQLVGSLPALRRPARGQPSMAVPSSLVARLEAVADKLERFQVSLESGSVAVPSGARSAATATAAAPAASVASAATTPKASAGSPAGGSVAEYDRLLQESLQPVVRHAQAIGGEVQQVTGHLAKAFEEQRKVLVMASLAKQPDVAALQQEVLQPVASQMLAAADMADNRRSTAFQQLKAVAEAMQGFGWLAYSGPGCGMPLPGQHVGDAWASAEFYANKLLMQYRGSDEAQVNWIKGLKDLMQGLQAFVRTNYSQGIKWNASGTSLKEAKAAAEAGSPALAGAAAAAAPKPAAGKGGPPGPAPPPPPPGSLLQERPAKGGSGGAAAAGAAAGGGRAELLKALQQGDGVTSGLRKVTDDMKTKNRTDRVGKVEAGGPKPAAASAAAGAGVVTGTPRIALEQERKWVVEHQVGNQQIVIDQTTVKQTVYIYNCHQCVVQVKGKVNTISLDKCKQTGLVFEDVIASCEVVNCNSVQVQCLGAIPTVSIDKTDGCQLFVPLALAANPDFQVVSAKSSEMNIVVAPADPEKEDAVEHPVPEQFISSFKAGKLVTVAASHGGG